MNILNFVYVGKVLEIMHNSTDTHEDTLNTLHKQLKEEYKQILADDDKDGTEMQYRALVIRYYLKVINYIESYSLGVSAAVYNLQQAYKEEKEYIAIDCEGMA